MTEARQGNSAVARRARLYFARAAEAAGDWYDADGRWIAPTKPAETRERYWLALGLYAAGACDLADAIIRPAETP